MQPEQIFFNLYLVLGQFYWKCLPRVGLYGFSTVRSISQQKYADLKFRINYDFPGLYASTGSMTQEVLRPEMSFTVVTGLCYCSSFLQYFVGITLFIMLFRVLYLYCCGWYYNPYLSLLCMSLPTWRSISRMWGGLSPCCSLSLQSIAPPRWASRAAPGKRSWVASHMVSAMF